jgi:hypothetical protein
VIDAAAAVVQPPSEDARSHRVTQVMETGRMTIKPDTFAQLTECFSNNAGP